MSLQVATGLCTYFDKALHVRLLYDAELPQGDEVQYQPSCTMCRGSLPLA